MKIFHCVSQKPFLLLTFFLVIVCFRPVVIRLLSSRVKKVLTLDLKAAVNLFVGISVGGNRGLHSEHCDASLKIQGHFRQKLVACTSSQSSPLLPLLLVVFIFIFLLYSTYSLCLQSRLHDRVVFF